MSLQKSLDKINELDNIVISLFGADNADEWWKTPNVAFEDECPEDVPLAKVEEYLKAALASVYL
jgi:hypothetical protein